MAIGREFCMYCGDNRGLDIDHFEPVNRNPLRTFDWLNHLLACSGCNSGRKGDKFPTDDAGRPLLIDPSAEDPFDHLRLTLSLGMYTALTLKGKVTIDVCDLNNEILARGRQDARSVVEACIFQWARANEQDDTEEKGRWVRAIQGQPFADVCQTMLRLAELPSAPLVLESPDLIRLLQGSALREALLR
ncbi:HNH endonuclease [Actinomadura roseirufa]|uniref:HNH endonuclease n=1 Tax=Actinomadura roseirufa TaxID=2094049 RepID=UPI001A954831|nr:HNH endonuclease [Actinomadura roseirufa]